eukprot:TRINITY_DN25214_c0_g1_i1.p1 TRINITY_DN25214_c0_g1~~TRINITY_DN25214_c0_g1_i1.p1  ORF type:complete len:641 (+),score=136.29 TRINITY_DN25214_c0_g1_i1:106-2028(+)
MSSAFEAAEAAIARQMAQAPAAAPRHAAPVEDPRGSAAAGSGSADSGPLGFDAARARLEEAFAPRLPAVEEEAVPLAVDETALYHSEGEWSAASPPPRQQSASPRSGDVQALIRSFSRRGAAAAPPQAKQQTVDRPETPPSPPGSKPSNDEYSSSARRLAQLSHSSFRHYPDPRGRPKDTVLSLPDARRSGRSEGTLLPKSSPGAPAARPLSVGTGRLTQSEGRSSVSPVGDVAPQPPRAAVGVKSIRLGVGEHVAPPSSPPRGGPGRARGKEGTPRRLPSSRLPSSPASPCSPQGPEKKLYSSRRGGYSSAELTAVPMHNNDGPPLFVTCATPGRASSAPRSPLRHVSFGRSSTPSAAPEACVADWDALASLAEPAESVLLSREKGPPGGAAGAGMVTVPVDWLAPQYRQAAAPASLLPETEAAPRTGPAAPPPPVGDGAAGVAAAMEELQASLSTKLEAAAAPPAAEEPSPLRLGRAAPAAPPAAAAQGRSMPMRRSPPPPPLPTALEPPPPPDGTAALRAELHGRLATERAALHAARVSLSPARRASPASPAHARTTSPPRPPSYVTSYDHLSALMYHHSPPAAATAPPSVPTYLSYERDAGGGSVPRAAAAAGGGPPGPAGTYLRYQRDGTPSPAL